MDGDQEPERKHDEKDDYAENEAARWLDPIHEARFLRWADEDSNYPSYGLLGQTISSTGSFST